MAATKKQTAPPPPTGFTGFVPNKPLKERAKEAWQNRRSRRLSRPPRPLIQINTGPGSQGSRRPAARRYKRRRPRRGALFGVLSVVVAAGVLTIAAVELASWTTASVIFAGAEGVSAFTAFAFGDPAPPKPKTPPKPKKSPAAGNPPPGSGGHKCGAPTKDKANNNVCQNPVTNPGDKCWRHPGGKGAPQPSTAPNTPKVRKTKKTAPPPPPNP